MCIFCSIKCARHFPPAVSDILMILLRFLDTSCLPLSQEVRGQGRMNGDMKLLEAQ